MGKSKVYLNSKIILFIFAILIALACSKKLSAAETATFAISNVTIGQKKRQLLRIQKMILFILHKLTKEVSVMDI